MNGLKGWLSDFPTANGRVVATIVIMLATAAVVIVRLVLGAPFPSGYDTWLWVLVAMAGVDSAHVVGKRLSDFRYKQAGTSPVTVEAAAGNVTVEAPAVKPATGEADTDADERGDL